jgi:glutamyl-tRNA reductase
MTNFNSSNSNNSYVVKASVRDIEMIADLLAEGLVDIDDLYNPYEEERKKERKQAVEEIKRTAKEQLESIKEWVEF